LTLRLSRTFFGTASLERECEGFRLALRRGTVPPDAVPEHSHETAHLILAIDEDYQTGAIGAAAWRGPSMIIYNPPGTLHRDRFAKTGGRFLSIDFPKGFEPRGLIDPVVVSAGAARSRVSRVLNALIDDAPALDAEDRLLDLSVALASAREPGRFAPSWLRIANEAIADLTRQSGLRVQDVAELAGVHPVHLARAFSQHFGCSPGAAIRRARVERAAAALTGRCSLGDIAQACGFADQAHMTRSFRATYGITPTAFRDAFG